MSLLKTLQFITYHPLSRGRRLRSLLDFMRWQLESRLAQGPLEYEWIGGSRLLVRRGEAGLTGNVYCGLHEFADMAYVLHVSDPSDLFVDVGANVGSYTILACAVRGARGCCFEPVPETFRRLVANVRLNGVEDRVLCLNVGVGDRPGVLRFTCDQDCMNHVITADAQGGVEANVVRLDDVLAGQAPTIVKIDVEGFEAKVIEGARRTLALPSVHSLIVELNGGGERYGINEASIVETLAALGFAPHRYDPFERRLHPLAGKNGESANTLFIRDAARVQPRLREAPPIRVKGRAL